MIRDLLRQIGLDRDRFGTSAWNPFGEFINPGNTVVIKPNLCKHVHHLGDEGVLSTITNGSVLRPIIDYVWLALHGEGKIIVCDTPFEHTDYDEVLRISGIGSMVRHLKEDYGYPVELIDLREYVTAFHTGRNVTQARLPGDPLGYVTVNLGENSEFRELDDRQQNYHTLADHSVDHYDPFGNDVGAPNNHHRAGLHEYRVSKTILSADAIISVPKLKTHGKTGVTLNLKNMIGIVSGKTYMPHHRPGNPPFGDAFPTAPPTVYVKNRITRRSLGNIFFKAQGLIGGQNSQSMARWLRKRVLDNFWPIRPEEVIEWGDWSGNDTLWRTVVDLNKALIYSDDQGELHDEPQRRYFSIIDGVVGQEGQGPSAGEPKVVSAVVGGFNPVSTDAIASMIMGLDPRKLAIVTRASGLSLHHLGESSLDLIDMKCNVPDLPNGHFRVAKGWQDSIELELEESSTT